MKFPILFLSIILSVWGLDVRGGFDGITSPIRSYTIYIDADYGEDWVPITFNYTIFVDVQAPSPTNWTYYIDDIELASGTEDFCDPTPMTPGGIAIQILRHGFDLEDRECPLPRYTKGTNIQWTWAEAQSYDLEDIFNAAATATGPSMNSDVPTPSTDMSEETMKPPGPDAAADPSPSPQSASGGLKRRRRDPSLLSVTLNLVNRFVDTRFILSAKV